jgi:hypothetical protein
LSAKAGAVSVTASKLFVRTARGAGVGGGTTEGGGDASAGAVFVEAGEASIEVSTLGAGIGGGNGAGAGAITVRGGTFAVKGTSGAAIGGGNSGGSGGIDISVDSLSATGFTGIGGGPACGAGDITIGNGVYTAAGSGGAGIGGGASTTTANASVGAIAFGPQTVVTATAVGGGAAIGGGSTVSGYSVAASVAITGGTFALHAVGGGAALGGGTGTGTSSIGTVTISGGSVTCTTEGIPDTDGLTQAGAPVGAGFGATRLGIGTLRITGGTVNATAPAGVSAIGSSGNSGSVAIQAIAIEGGTVIAIAGADITTTNGLEGVGAIGGGPGHITGTNVESIVISGGKLTLAGARGIGARRFQAVNSIEIRGPGKVDIDCLATATSDVWSSQEKPLACISAAVLSFNAANLDVTARRDHADAAVFEVPDPQTGLTFTGQNTVFVQYPVEQTDASEPAFAALPRMILGGFPLASGVYELTFAAEGVEVKAKYDSAASKALIVTLPGSKTYQLFFRDEKGDGGELCPDKGTLTLGTGVLFHSGFTICSEWSAVPALPPTEEFTFQVPVYEKGRKFLFISVYTVMTSS